MTDSLVASTVGAIGSEKAAFEPIITAAVGAGLLRWENAVKAINAVRGVHEVREASA